MLKIFTRIHDPHSFVSRTPSKLARVTMPTPGMVIVEFVRCLATLLNNLEPPLCALIKILYKGLLSLCLGGGGGGV